MVTRAVILSVENRFPDLPGSGRNADGTAHYYAIYKVLKRGRKKARYDYVRARDELEAFTFMRDRLRRQGYKL